MSRRDEKAGGLPDMAQAIRRQLHLGDNARYLRRMPGFELDDRTPDRFEKLLGALDEAESRAE